MLNFLMARISSVTEPCLDFNKYLLDAYLASSIVLCRLKATVLIGLILLANQWSVENIVE